MSTDPRIRSVKAGSAHSGTCLVIVGHVFLRSLDIFYLNGFALPPTRQSFGLVIQTKICVCGFSSFSDGSSNLGGSF